MNEQMKEVSVTAVELVPSSIAIEAQERAAIDMQIATAKAYPRIMSEVREEVLALATADRETAEACFYALPREGKVITGPSVRLAEIVASSYRNLRIQARIVSIDNTHVTAQGACIDLERNTAGASEVKRRIVDKHGRRYSEDMIITTCNAAMAIARRNAIFGVVPAAIFKATFDDIRKVGMGDERTLTDRLAAMVVWYEKRGVSEAQLLDLVEKRRREDISLEDLFQLKALAEAIREGAASLEEVFPKGQQAAPSSSKLAEILGRKQPSDQTASEEQKPARRRGRPASKPAQAEPAPEPTGVQNPDHALPPELGGDAGDSAPTVACWKCGEAWPVSELSPDKSCPPGKGCNA